MQIETMERPLKAELHAHTKEDLKDYVKYNAEYLIDKMADAGYDVLSITNHDIVTYNDHLKNYAQKRDMLLIPGVEATVENKHVILINVTDYAEGDIKRFGDLKRYKKKDSIVMAPHPYFPVCTCLGPKLNDHIDMFDAIEYSHYYTTLINRNVKAKKIAEEMSIPLIGTSDIHFECQKGKTYTLINSKKDIGSIVEAIKNNRIEIVTKPLKHYEFFYTAFKHMVNGLIHR